MAVFTLGASSGDSNTGTPGQQAATKKAADTAAIQGLGASITVIQPDANKAQVEAQLLTSIASNTSTIMVNSSGTLEAAKMIHEEIRALRNDFTSKVFEIKLSDAQFAESMKMQEKQQQDLKRIAPAYSSFNKIVNLIMNRDWETKANAFLKASEIFGKGFEMIGKGIATIKAAPILALGAAIAVLGLSIWAFGEVVTAEGMIKTFVTLAALGLLFKFLYSKEMTNGLLKFAAGIALTGLAIWAFGELVNMDTILPVILALVGLAGALWLFNKIGNAKSTSISLLLAAGGVFALGYAIRSFDGVTMEQAIITGAAVAGLGLALRFFSPQSLIGAAALAVGAVGLGLLGLALRAVPDNIGDIVLPTLGFILGFGVAMAAAGAVAPLILAGSAAMGVAGLALLLIAGGLALVNVLNIDQEKIANFGSALLSISEIFLKIGIPVIAPFIILGAATGIAIGAASAVAAGGLALISALNIDQEKIANFGVSLQALADAYIDVGGPIKTARILLGVAAAIPMAAATIIAAGAFGLVSAFSPLKQNTVDSFKYALEKIADAYVSIGGPIKLLKIGMGVTAALMMSAATVSFAESINKIDKYEVTPTKAANATAIVDVFVTTMSETIEQNASRLNSIKDGIYAVNGLGNLMIGIADGVSKMANLNYVRYDVRNGKLVPVEVVKLKEDDFVRVGQGIAKMIGSMTGPLEQIGSKQDTINIYGIKVANPFSNKVQSGIEAMAGVGNLLNPIADTIKTFADKGMDTASALGFGKIIGIVIDSIAGHVQVLSDQKFFQDSRRSKEMFSALGDFFTSTADIDTGKLDSFAKSMDKIRMNMTNVKGDFNTIDLQRLTIFNEIAKNLASLDANNKLFDVIRELGLIAESIAGLTQTIANRDSAQPTNNWTNVSNIPNIPSGNTGIPVPFIKNPDGNEISISDITKELSEKLDKIAAKLGSPLLVNPANVDLWRQVFNTSRI